MMQWFDSNTIGVPLDKFLKDNGDKIDLRVRHALIQQVLNALANIHTGGSEDKMSLWGSFLGESVSTLPLVYYGGIEVYCLWSMKCILLIQGYIV